MMKKSLFLCAAMLAISTSASAQKVIFNDNFADGGRDNGADPADTNWWTTTTKQAIEVKKGALGLVSGSSGRGIRTTFAPQNLANGQTLKATFVFTTPQTVGQDKGSAFRIGMYNKLGRAALEGDLSASSKKPNKNYDGLPGYMIDFDVNAKKKADISVRKHNVETRGRLLGTTKGYKRLKGGGDQYKFAPGQTYTGTMAVQKVGNGITISGSLAQNGKVLSQFSHNDPASNVNGFGMLAFHVNSKTFGKSKRKNSSDNGIDFKKVTLQLLP